MSHSKAWIFASLLVTIELASYWLWFDQGLHATNRYYMRTALVVVTPVLGVLAVTKVFNAERWPLSFEVPWLMRSYKAARTGRAATRTILRNLFPDHSWFTPSRRLNLSLRGAITKGRCGRSQREQHPIETLEICILYPRPGSTQTSIGHPGTQRPRTCRCSWHQNSLQHGSWWIRLQTIFG